MTKINYKVLKRLQIVCLLFGEAMRRIVVVNHSSLDDPNFGSSEVSSALARPFRIKLFAIVYLRALLLAVCYEYLANACHCRNESKRLNS